MGTDTNHASACNASMGPNPCIRRRHSAEVMERIAHTPFTQKSGLQSSQSASGQTNRKHSTSVSGRTLQPHRRHSSTGLAPEPPPARLHRRHSPRALPQKTFGSVPPVFHLDKAQRSLFRTRLLKAVGKAEALLDCGAKIDEVAKEQSGLLKAAIKQAKDAFVEDSAIAHA